MPFPSPGELPNPGIEPRSPAFKADSLPVEPPEKPPNNKAKCVRIKFDQQNGQKFTTIQIECRAIKKTNKNLIGLFWVPLMLGIGSSSFLKAACIISNKITSHNFSHR